MHYHPKIKLFFCALLVILTTGLNNPATAGGGNPAVAAQAWPLIEHGALLIDVRAHKEYDAGHIEGALNIPYEDTGALVSAIGTDRQRQVVVYCRSGGRAGKAQAALTEKGYNNVFNATGYEALKASKP